MSDSPRAKGSSAIFYAKEISHSICGLAMEEQMKRVEGVKDIEASLVLDEVLVDYGPAKVGSNEIRKVVDKTGRGTHLELAKR